jgi:alpha-beta hydrolase superfamily lysophospholipase
VGTDGAHDGLAAFLTERDDAERRVAPFMRSQLHRGRAGAGTYVLLHGLTASPPAWRQIAAALHAAGSTVVVPRLLYHGYTNRMTRALRHLRAEALLDDVRAIVSRVASLGEPVTIVGHSLGATLAIGVGLEAPNVARIVPIAPFLGIASLPREVHPLLVGALGSVGDIFLWWDPVQRERLAPLHGYPRYPLRALATGITIADAAHASAHHAQHGRGIDLVINERESSVNNRTALLLAREWRNAGASVAIHHLRGLGWSHDIIEPDRAPAQAALPVLLRIIAEAHASIDRDHRLDRVAAGRASTGSA